MTRGKWRRGVRRCRRGCLSVCILIILGVALAIPATFIFNFEANTAYKDNMFEGGVFTTLNGYYWSLGFGKESITPNLQDGTYYMSGNGNTPDGIADDVFVRAVVFDNNSPRLDLDSVALVTIDSAGLTRKDINQIRDHLAEYCYLNKISTVNIMATNAGANVDMMGTFGKNKFTSGKNDDYVASLKEKTLSALKQANESLINGTLTLGTTQLAADLVEDVRIPDNYDKNLFCLTFVPDDVEYNTIYIVNFGVTDAVAADNTKISAGWTKHMGDAIKEKDNCAEYMFINGASGTVMQAGYQDIKDGKVAQQTAAEDFGRAIGGLVNGITNKKVIAPRLNYNAQRVFMPLTNYATVAQDILDVVDRDIVRNGIAFEAVTEVGYLELGLGVECFRAVLVPGALFPEIANGAYLATDLSANGGEIPYGGKNFYAMLPREGSRSVFGFANDNIGYIIPANDYYVDAQLPNIRPATDPQGRDHTEELTTLSNTAASNIIDALAKLIAKSAG